MANTNFNVRIDKDGTIYFGSKIIGSIVMDPRREFCGASPPLSIQPWLGIAPNAPCDDTPRDVSTEKTVPSVDKEELAKLKEYLKKLEEKVALLEETKITKPSLASELLEAERYMDDYSQIRKEYRIKRLAQKQRTKRKLKRLEKMAAHKELNKRREELYRTIATLMCVLFAAIGIIGAIIL